MIRPENVGMSSERLARIRPGIKKHISPDKIAGAVTLLARRGEIVHFENIGLMDRENNKPMQNDTIFRIFSMTKPIVSVALMMLYETGQFQLFDPVSKYIPAFKDLKVYQRTGDSSYELADLNREVTIRDLLTHTSGLTYPFLEYGPVEEMYRADVMKFWSKNPLSGFITDLLKLPLAFQPGSHFRYSFSTDVVAYLIEVISGKFLDVFLRETLFEPLGMIDTGYHVPQYKLTRFAAMYGSGKLGAPKITITEMYQKAEEGINILLASPSDSLESKPHNIFRGGVGLVSTASDYLKFCQMLLNMGELNGKRYLSRKTIELMTTNHLSPELLPFEIGEIDYPGYGFGLGFRVLIDVGQNPILGSLGEYGWAGAATTYFWVDPKEELIGIQMAQFQPSGFHLIKDDFRVTAYQAIVD